MKSRVPVQWVVWVVTGQLSLFGSGCASMFKSRLELKSQPTGAEVTTPSGEKLGVTPLTLESETLSRIGQDGWVRLLMQAPGCAEREIVYQPRGDDHHEVMLTQLDGGYFAGRMVNVYQPQMNEMVRSIVQAQGLLFGQKFSDAEKTLADFQTRYPGIAAAYVLSASLEAKRGDRKKATQYLLRARQLDPADPVASRMLGPDEKTASEKAGGP